MELSPMTLAIGFIIVVGGYYILNMFTEQKVLKSEVSQLVNMIANVPPAPLAAPTPPTQQLMQEPREQQDLRQEMPAYQHNTGRQQQQHRQQPQIKSEGEAALEKMQKQYGDDTLSNLFG